MASDKQKPEAGEELVKHEIITRDELNRAKEREAQTGTPWYKQLVQMRKVSFEALENVLRYEIHGKAKHAEHKTLGDRLVEEGALTREQLQQALAEQKRNGRLLGNILVERNYVGRDAVGRALSKQYGMQYAELAKTPSQPAALEAIPESMAYRDQVLPVSLEGDRLTALITSPQKLKRLKEMSIILGIRIHGVLTTSEDFGKEIQERYRLGQGKSETAARSDKARQEEPPASIRRTPAPQKATSAGRALQTTPMREESEGKSMESKKSAKTAANGARFQEIADQASGASVVKMVSTIIEGAVNAGATDIHLDPQEPEMRVRYRIDGVLHDVMSIPENIETAVVSRVKIISELDITETRRPQDGHISMSIGSRELDIRVATLPTFLGERVVLRLLDQSSVLSGIKDLGLEKEDEETLMRLIEQPYGMILVTGPTGSGKTTTLYAALNLKNVMTDSIVTLEDPVEYQLSGINQVQVDPDIDMTFANVLRASLRQDIDVLLVGEIRDMETARIAIRAAMTGHLVFSTLHTNDAPEAISTLRNMGVPSYLISSALTAVIGQRLVRTICSKCRTEFKPTPTLLKSIGMPTTTTKLFRGQGCDSCYHTGNRGRTGIFEVLEVTPEVRRQIAAEESTEKIAKDAKLKTMAMRCREKVKQGIVTPEEFLRVIRT